jgi:hypothetical protein
MKPNNLTKDIAKGVSKHPRPSLRTVGKWREEWKTKGLDFKCSFESYKRHKIKIWNKQRREKKILATSLN